MDEARHPNGRTSGATADTAGGAAIEPIEGGLAAPAGFRAAGVSCGIKASGLDLALIVSEPRSSAAGLFTTSLAAAAPVTLCKQHLDRSSGLASAIVVNSGCANACTGAEGDRVAGAMARETAGLLGCPVEHVLVASTGVIGVALDGETVTRGIRAAHASLSREHHLAAARAIMTTDPWPKERAVRVRTSSGTFHVGGIAKGAGMIEPHLATMLAFLTTDAGVGPEGLKRALVAAVEDTFNAITVDGDSSTNDTVLALANGLSGVAIDEALHPLLIEALRAVCRALALAIVRGGEGATKVVAVRVCGAPEVAHARQAARAIANSLLVKTAIHGGDPNWGRLVAVAARAGVPFELARAAVRIGSVVVFENGQPFDGRAPQAADHLRNRDVEILVDLGAGGPYEATVWTCDLSAEYVRINAAYRT